MGSPVSVVTAEIVMQNIEEQALATYTRAIIPLWLCYVDNNFYHVLYAKTDTLKVRTRTNVYQGNRIF